MIEACPPHALTAVPTPEAEKRKFNPKKRKAKHECDIVAKIALKKKKREEKS